MSRRQPGLGSDRCAFRELHGKVTLHFPWSWSQRMTVRWPSLCLDSLLSRACDRNPMDRRSCAVTRSQARQAIAAIAWASSRSLGASPAITWLHAAPGIFSM